MRHILFTYSHDIPKYLHIYGSFFSPTNPLEVSPYSMPGQGPMAGGVPLLCHHPKIQGRRQRRRRLRARCCGAGPAGCPADVYRLEPLIVYYWKLDGDGELGAFSFLRWDHKSVVLAYLKWFLTSKERGFRTIELVKIAVEAFYHAKLVISVGQFVGFTVFNG